ncbi:hypothetical protein GCM10023156_29230 [Novipirellula rosea]|uniref:Uncharacterized protein n=2 Tax=Novipirellula rosea TaxID=1031540 RepID=A0ABP8MVB0_9BACT
MPKTKRRGSRPEDHTLAAMGERIKRRIAELGPKCTAQFEAKHTEDTPKCPRDVLQTIIDAGVSLSLDRRQTLHAVHYADDFPDSLLRLIGEHAASIGAVIGGRVACHCSQYRPTIEANDRRLIVRCRVCRQSLPKRRSRKNK